MPDGVQDGVTTAGHDVITEGDALQVARAVSADADREGAAAEEDVGGSRKRRSKAKRTHPALVAGQDRQLPLVDESTVQGVRTRRIPVIERERAAAYLDERGARAADDLAGVGPIGALAADGERRTFHEQGSANVLYGALDEGSS